MDNERTVEIPDDLWNRIIELLEKEACTEEERMEVEDIKRAAIY